MKDVVQFYVLVQIDFFWFLTLYVLMDISALLQRKLHWEVILSPYLGALRVKWWSGWIFGYTNK